MLELARLLKEQELYRSVRFVAFVNEEAPFYYSEEMGSRVYAERCKARRDNIVAMISVDGVGCYSNKRGSQKYPALIGWPMPSRANFVAFASDRKNRVRSKYSSSFKVISTLSLRRNNQRISGDRHDCCTHPGAQRSPARSDERRP